MKLSDMCRFPLFGLAALLILSGCSMERVGSPSLVPSGTPYSASDAESLKLTQAEQAVFSKTNVPQLFYGSDGTLPFREVFP